jgi:hypothetical protein
MPARNVRSDIKRVILPARRWLAVMGATELKELLI